MSSAPTFDELADAALLEMQRQQQEQQAAIERQLLHSNSSNVLVPGVPAKVGSATDSRARSWPLPSLPSTPSTTSSPTSTNSPPSSPTSPHFPLLNSPEPGWWPQATATPMWLHSGRRCQGWLWCWCSRRTRQRAHRSSQHALLHHRHARWALQTAGLGREDRGKSREEDSRAGDGQAVSSDGHQWGLHLGLTTGNAMIHCTSTQRAALQ